MLLSVRDLTAILKVPEATIYRWVRDRNLPAQEINGHYRTHPVDLLQWLADHPVPVNPAALPTDALTGSGPSLEAAIRAGGTYHDLPGTTREDAFSALASRLPGVAGLPVEDLRLLLVRRESVGVVFLKEGMAVPHPHYPIIHSAVLPMLAIGFPTNPIPWNGKNGNGSTLRIIFTLITPTVRAHLRLIGRVIFALHDPRFKELLARKATGAEFETLCRNLDHAMTTPAAASVREVAQS